MKYYILIMGSTIQLLEYPEEGLAQAFACGYRTGTTARHSVRDSVRVLSQDELYMVLDSGLASLNSPG